MTQLGQIVMLTCKKYAVCVLNILEETAQANLAKLSIGRQGAVMPPS